MHPVLFVILVLSGALTLLLALTLGPRNNKVLGFMLLIGGLLLMVPLLWMLLAQIGWV